MELGLGANELRLKKQMFPRGSNTGGGRGTWTNPYERSKVLNDAGQQKQKEISQGDRGKRLIFLQSSRCLYCCLMTIILNQLRHHYDSCIVSKPLDPNVDGSLITICAKYNCN